MNKSKKKSRVAPTAVVGEPFLADRTKEELAWWRKTDPKIATRISALITDIRRHRFSGIGTRAPLRYDSQGYWSRRITAEHRLVYRVEAGRLYTLQARYHY